MRAGMSPTRAPAPPASPVRVRPPSVPALPLSQPAAEALYPQTSSTRQQHEGRGAEGGRATAATTGTGDAAATSRRSDRSYSRPSSHPRTSSLPVGQGAIPRGIEHLVPGQSFARCVSACSRSQPSQTSPCWRDLHCIALWHVVFCCNCGEADFYSSVRTLRSCTAACACVPCATPSLWAVAAQTATTSLQRVCWWVSLSRCTPHVLAYLDSFMPSRVTTSACWVWSAAGV
jgi:hypothetical protein